MGPAPVANARIARIPLIFKQQMRLGCDSSIQPIVVWQHPIPSRCFSSPAGRFIGGFR